jgi:hypothetical protein
MSQLQKKYKVLGISLLVFLIASSLPIFGIFSPRSQDDTTNESPEGEKLSDNLKSAGITIDNFYDFSKGIMENVTLDERDRLTLDKTVSWTNMNPATKPSARNRHAMAYDSTNHKIILFGGIDAGDSYDETWVYDLGTNTWTNMNPSTKPSARWDSAMVFDSDAHKVILFGGDDGNYDDETWTYDLGSNTWSNMNPATKPSARSRHAMAYDSTNHKIILFGGESGPGGYLDDTWSYDLETNTWTNMNPISKPSARSWHAMVYDSYYHKVILFGGYPYDDETWTYDLGTNTWTNMNPTTKPSARLGHAMVYDSDVHKVILFGGDDAAEYDDETWTYDLGKQYLETNTWTNLNPTTKPSGRCWHAMAFDSDAHKAILFGGRAYDDETWVFALNQHYRTGRFDSQLIDVEAQRQITGQISWNPTEQPTGTDLSFQVGFSNSTLEAEFTFTPLSSLSFSFESIARYMRYRINFASDTDQLFSPQIETVKLNYTMGISEEVLALIEALQNENEDQQNLIDELQNLIEDLQNENEDQQNQIEDLQNQLDELQDDTGGGIPGYPLYLLAIGSVIGLIEMVRVIKRKKNLPQ